MAAIKEASILTVDLKGETKEFDAKALKKTALSLTNYSGNAFTTDGTDLIISTAASPIKIKNFTKLKSYRTSSTAAWQDIIASGLITYTGPYTVKSGKVTGTNYNDIMNFSAEAGKLAINSGKGNDIIYGGDGVNTITSGDGNDIIYGSKGADTITGGKGKNVIKYTSLDQINGDKIKLTKGENIVIDISDLKGATAEYKLNGSGLNVEVTYGGKKSTLTLTGFGTKDVLNNKTKKTKDTSSILLQTSSGAYNLKDVYVKGLKGTWHNDYIDRSDYKLYTDKKKTVVQTDYTKKGLTLKSGAGNDIIVGTNYSDTLKGEAGNDKIYGGSGNDKIYGGKDNDTIQGGTGNNSIYLYKGDGNDVILNGGGEDTIVFAKGTKYTHKLNGKDLVITYGDNDTVTLKNYMDGHSVRYLKVGKTQIELVNIQPIPEPTAVPTVEPTVAPTIPTVPTVPTAPTTPTTPTSPTTPTTPTTPTSPTTPTTPTSPTQPTVAPQPTVTEEGGYTVYQCTAYDDVINGTSGKNKIYGYDGNDTLNGGASDDIIDGGNGSDIISAGAGNDTVTGGAGDDKITAGTGNDTIDGGAGTNTFIFNGGSGQDVIKKGSGTDTVQLNTKSNLKFSRDMSNNDLVMGYGTGTDKITFKDYFNGNSHSVKTVKNGDETLSLQASMDKYGITITGTANADTITGSAGADTINAGAGNDTITGGKGNDTIDGGAGNNTYIFNAGDGADTIADTSSADTIKIEVKGVKNNITLTPSGINKTTKIGKLIVAGYGNGDSIIINNFNFGKISDNLAAIQVKNSAGTGYDTITISDLLVVPVELANNETYDATTYAYKQNISLASNTTSATVSNLKATDNITLAGATLSRTWNTTDKNKLVISNAGKTITVSDFFNSSDPSYHVGKLNNTNIYTSGKAINVTLADNTNVYACDNNLNETISGTGKVSGLNANDKLKFTSATTYSLTASGLTVSGGNSITVTDNNTGVMTNVKTFVGDTADNLGTKTLTVTGIANFNASSLAFKNCNITGTTAADTITGGKGNDTLNGGDGNDTINGGEGNDTITGGAGADTINAGAGNDTITGGKGNDTIDGGAGTNTFIFNAGDGKDVIKKGSGTDTIDITTTSGIYLSRNFENKDLIINYGDDSVTLENYFVNNSHSVKNVKVNGENNSLEDIVNYEIIYTEGTDNDDNITGTGYNDYIYSYAGNDIINGGAGTDNIFGGEGNDTIYGGDGGDGLVGDEGDDTIYGGDGDDYIYGGFIDEYSTDSGNNTINGGAGNDSLIGNLGNDTIHGGEGVDEIYGIGGTNFLYGDAGNDYIEGGVGDDTIEGGAGNDNIYGGEGNDTIDGGTGNDYLEGDEGNDTIHGGEGVDEIYGIGGTNFLYGDDGDDKIWGGVGNDTIEGGNGDDYIDGGAGNDIIYGHNIFGGTGNNTIYGGEGDDYIFGGNGDDYIEGEEGIDEIYGGDGNDEIYGNNGDDYINGGAGNDTLDGGAGTNTFVFNDGSGQDTIIKGDGTDTVRLNTKSTLKFSRDMSNKDLVMEYGTGTDKIIFDYYFKGNTHSVQTIKNGADDPNPKSLEDAILANGLTITGTEDADIKINGSEGADTIYGNGGDDYIGGNGGDDYIEGGAGNDEIYGNDGDDTISGDDGDDTIYGNAGDDTLDGCDGNDKIYGGDGIDTIYGGAGNDTIEGGAGIDYIEGGAGNDTISGGVGDDDIYGNAGDDTINGDVGDDYIEGGKGNDTINTGLGSDTIYHNAGDGNDIIVMAYGSDTLELDGETSIDILTRTRIGNDSVIKRSNNETITLQDYYDGGVGHSVSNVKIDGDVFAITDIKNIIVSSEQEIIVDEAGKNDVTSTYTGDGNAIVRGKAGDDTIHITDPNRRYSLFGNKGNDTYVIDCNNVTVSNIGFHIGDGNDTLTGVTNVTEFDLAKTQLEIGGDDGWAMRQLHIAPGERFDYVKGTKSGNDLTLYLTSGEKFTIKDYYSLSETRRNILLRMSYRDIDTSYLKQKSIEQMVYLEGEGGNLIEVEDNVSSYDVDDSGKLVVAERETNSARQLTVNGDSNKVIQMGQNVQYTDVNGDGNEVYVVNKGTDTINTNHNTVSIAGNSNTVKISGGNYTSLTMDDNLEHNTIYVHSGRNNSIITSQDGSTLLVVDGTDENSINRIYSQGGDSISLEGSKNNVYLEETTKGRSIWTTENVVEANVYDLANVSGAVTAYIGVQNYADGYDEMFSHYYNSGANALTDGEDYLDIMIKSNTGVVNSSNTRFYGNWESGVFDLDTDAVNTRLAVAAGNDDFETIKKLSAMTQYVDMDKVTNNYTFESGILGLAQDVFVQGTNQNDNYLVSDISALTKQYTISEKGGSDDTLTVTGNNKFRLFFDVDTAGNVKGDLYIFETKGSDAADYDSELDKFLRQGKYQEANYICIKNNNTMASYNIENIISGNKGIYVNNYISAIKASVASWLNDYNTDNGTSYSTVMQAIEDGAGNYSLFKAYTINAQTAWDSNLYDV